MIILVSNYDNICHNDKSMNNLMARAHVELKSYIKVLSECISLPRRQKIAQVIASRRDNIAVLLENVVDTGNENAVTRTMEGLGFHRLYKLKNDPRLKYPVKKMGKPQSRTDAGAKKWLFKYTSENTDDCISEIRRGSYQLACAIPSASLSIFDLDLSEKKTVFVFGNESSGVTRRLCEEADVNFSLPMCGFVKSYNVSVAAAITLFHAYTQLKSKKVLLLLMIAYIIVHVDFKINSFPN